MPPKSLTPKRSCPISIDDEDIAYIERAGVGKNFSEKARSIIKKASIGYDVLAVYAGEYLVHSAPKAIRAYYEFEGEKLWGKLPFDFNKKDGYQKMISTAQSLGYVTQVITKEETGFVVVWIAPAPKSRNCAECRKKILEILPC